MSLQQLQPDESFEKLYHSIFPEVTDKNGSFGNQSQWWQLVNTEGQMVAFCTTGVIINQKVAFLYNVGVNPQFRHQGWGTKMLSELFKTLPKYEFYLFVRQDNQIAIHMYQQLGFIPSPRSYVPPKGEICLKRLRRQ